MIDSPGTKADASHNRKAFSTSRNSPKVRNVNGIVRIVSTQPSVALTNPIAIAANALRVAGTGFLAHFVGPEAAQGFYHLFAGWMVFAVAFVLLLGAGTLLGRLPDGRSAPAAPVEGQP